jgi:hypothetical protein
VSGFPSTPMLLEERNNDTSERDRRLRSLVPQNPFKGVPETAWVRRIQDLHAICRQTGRDVQSPLDRSQSTRDYLSQYPHQYETIHEKPFHNYEREAAGRIAADLFAIANSIFPSSLVYARKEIEETIAKVQGLYFKRFGIGLCIKSDRYWTYLERWTCGCVEKVDGDSKLWVEVGVG